MPPLPSRPSSAATAAVVYVVTLLLRCRAFSSIRIGNCLKCDRCCFCFSSEREGVCEKETESNACVRPHAFPYLIQFAIKAQSIGSTVLHDLNPELAHAVIISLAERSRARVSSSHTRRRLDAVSHFHSLLKQYLFVVYL